MTARFERVAVIGVGLIGGSFALALKAARACTHVVGVGRDPANVRQALERGVLDSSQTDPAAAARGADLVLVATPVAQSERIFAAIAPTIASHALVTDAGSTKRDVIAAARAALGAKLAQFVPAHPIAGGERSGVGVASAELFRGKRTILVPLPENAPQAIERVALAWQACGATVERMSAEEHDTVLAAVSHLPHLLAYALVHEVAGRANSAQLLSYAAGGFRDFTRIASSRPEMWRDICLANRDRLLEEIARFDATLGEVRKLLERGDGAALERLFAGARAARERWISSS